WQVERKYYPGRYQWRIRIVRGQKDHKEKDLSPPSQTWSFSWLSPVPPPIDTAEIWQPPPTYTPTPLYSPTPRPTPSCDDLTVYLRGTNNAEGFVAFSGEHVNAGWIYTEGAYVYGEIAARIGNREFHCDTIDKPNCTPERFGPIGARPLAPYHVKLRFSDSLLAATKGVEPELERWSLRFWVGVLDCNSATPPDKPYKIEMTLYAGEEARKHTEISFFVVDDPLCGGSP
ncbi:MAG: hypothetical protein JSV36_09080, partial [Anaerolineae bacterium]